MTENLKLGEENGRGLLKVLSYYLSEGNEGYHVKALISFRSENRTGNFTNEEQG